MKKRLFSLLLALMLFFSMVPAAAHAAVLDNGIVYDVYNTHVVITDYTGSAERLTIPARIEGLPVSTIATDAFSECNSLVEITVPEGVQRLERGAFSKSVKLTTVHLPDGLTQIERLTFDGCTSLSAINIPNTVTSIGEYAFRNCDSLVSIFIPANTTNIHRDSFMHCNSLLSIDVDRANTAYSSHDGTLYNKEMTTLICCPGGTPGTFLIPATVDYVMNAFDGCYSLTDIQVEKGNQHYSSKNGILYNYAGYTLIRCPLGKRGSLSLPDNTVAINPLSFEDCCYLTNIFLPDGVRRIGTGCFKNCTALTHVHLPDTVTEIEQMVFNGCSSLTQLTIPASVTQIGGCAFCKSGLQSIRFEGSAPQFESKHFDIDFTAYYPDNDPTWEEIIHDNYDAVITWVPYNPDNSFPDNSFTDVPDGAFYEAPVIWAVENGITTGTTADTFDPNGKCLRAHVVTFLHRAAEIPEPSAGNNPFTDVKTTDFFYKPVLWAVEQGITNGVSQTRFGSYDVCNRAAVVTFLWRTAGSPNPRTNMNPFKDVKMTDFFFKPVLWAVENGITTGLSATQFGPNAACNRAQVVTFLYRAYN